jgi:hypothetical protein
MADEGTDKATAAPGGDGTRREVSLERVFSRTFGTIRSNPVGTLGIAFTFSALPLLLFNYFSQGARGPEALIRIGTWGSAAGLIVGFIVGVALASLTLSALVRATVAHSEGRESSIAESVIAGLRAFVPLMALTIMATVAELIGFVFLIVPGVIVYCVLAVAAPALVAEGIGPVAAMDRSADLTSGARWKVFGIGLVVGIGTWAVTATFSALSFQMVGGMQALAEATSEGRVPLAYFVIEAIGRTLSSCVWGVLASALYVELRDWKEGPRSEALAEVFA